jgi:hypothetical protein
VYNTSLLQQLGNISCHFLPLGGITSHKNILHLLSVKNQNNGNNSTTTEAKEKINADLESLELKKNNVSFTKFKNNKI